MLNGILLPGLLLMKSTLLLFVVIAGVTYLGSPRERRSDHSSPG